LGGSLTDAGAELICLGAQLGVTEGRNRGLQLADAPDKRPYPLQLALVLAADDLLDDVQHVPGLEGLRA
jgi:hypothetical protein